jgi:hypothetical protein
LKKCHLHLYPTDPDGIGQHLFGSERKTHNRTLKHQQSHRKRKKVVEDCSGLAPTLGADLINSGGDLDARFKGTQVSVVSSHIPSSLLVM